MQRQRKSVELVDEVKNLVQEEIKSNTTNLVNSGEKITWPRCSHWYSNLPFTGTCVVSVTVELGFPKRMQCFNIHVFCILCQEYKGAFTHIPSNALSVFPTQHTLEEGRGISIPKKQSLFFLCKKSSLINSYLFLCIASNSDDKIFWNWLPGCLLNTVSPELPGISLKCFVWLIFLCFRCASSVRPKEGEGSCPSWDIYKGLCRVDSLAQRSYLRQRSSMACPPLSHLPP